MCRCPVPRLEFIGQPIHNSLVKIIPTQMCITSSCHHLKDAATNLQSGSVA